MKTGRYGYIKRNDEPYVLPITYVYKDGFIYSYTQEGHKINAMRKNPRICVQVERVESGIEWESVVCWGQFEEVTMPESMEEIKLLLAEEHGKILLQDGKEPVSPMVEDLHKKRSGEIETSVIYRMRPDRMTGRAEKV